MMVICGKCGFYQPHDRYCASCGIDMLAYIPQRKPLLKRLFSNHLVQLAFVVLMVGVGFGVARYQKNHVFSIGDSDSAITSSALVKESRPAQKKSDPSSQTNPAPSAPDSATNASISASNAPHPPGDGSSASLNSAISPGEKSVGLSADSPQPMAPPAAAATAAAPAAGATSEMKIVFGEMNRQYVDQIIAEDRGASTYGAVKAAVISGIDARLKAAKDALAWNQLDATDSQAMRAGQSIHVFRGAEYSGQQFGLMIRALPGSQDETGTPLRIEIISKLLDSSANPSIEEIKVPVPDAYVLPKGGAVLISGALPRRALQPIETRLYGSAEIFRVFRSENYRSGFSEFVILIESK